MSDIAPGWYKDPADPKTQRFWDGEGWLGEAISADAVPPIGPPPVAPPPVVIAAAATPTDVTQIPVTHIPGPPFPGPPFPESDTPGSAPAGQVLPTNPANPAPAGTTTLPPGATLGAPPAWMYGYPYSQARTKQAPRPHGLALAGVGARLVARIVDIMAVFGLSAVANGWFAYRWWLAFEPFMREFTTAQQTGAASPTPPLEIAKLMLMMCAVTVAVWFAYEVPGTANTGQTLGKRLLGIKVMRLESEDRLGFGRALRRWGRMGLPVLLWSFWGIGFLLQFLDCLFVPIDRPLHQALHDKSAGTVVVAVARSTRRDVTPVIGSEGGRHADPR